MSVELATLTGLKNDLRTFGAATKEITGTAGEALSKGDRFYIGTDGNFYKTLGAEESKGEFSLDQETGRILEHSYSWTIKQDVNSNGWVSAVLWRSYSNTNLNTQNILIHVLINPSDGSITTTQLYSTTYRSGSTSFSPYIRRIYAANTFFIDDTHFIVLHDEGYVNRNSSNVYSGGTARTYAKVYSLDESTGTTSLLSSATNNYLSNSTSSAFDYGPDQYAQFWQGDKHTYWYKSYITGTHYGVKRTVNPTTYALSDSSYTYGNGLVSNRSSDHHMMGFVHSDTHNRTYVYYTNTPSSVTSQYAYSSNESTSITVTNAPDTQADGAYNYYSLVDNLLVGGMGAYAYDKVTKTSSYPGTMKVYEITSPSASSIEWVEYPLEIGNFPFDSGVQVDRYGTQHTNNRTWTKIGNDYYYLMHIGIADYIYTTENNTTQSTPRYDLVVAKLTKDTVNSKYILDFVAHLDDVTFSREGVPYTIFKTTDDNLKVLAYNFTGDGGGSGSFEMYEMVTYDVTPYSSANVTGQPVSGNIKADTASGATATAVVSGQLADIAVPVGTAINGWVGIGNNQAIKED